VLSGSSHARGCWRDGSAPAHAGAGLAGDQEILPSCDPLAAGELGKQRLVDAACGVCVEILDDRALPKVGVFEAQYEPLALALDRFAGQKACRDDRSVLYHRVPRLLDALALARGDGRYPRLLKSLARVELLILDDWGLAPLTSQQGRDLLDIDDRHGRGSTIVTSQIPVKHWHELIADPTIADAVLDRLVHASHRLELDGPSLRDPKAGSRTEPASVPMSAMVGILQRRDRAANDCRHTDPLPWLACHRHRICDWLESVAGLAYP
jgi:hypothetical protein